MERLVRLAIPYEDRFAGWVDIGRLLAPYATFFRYPGIVIEPSASYRRSDNVSW